MQVRQPELCLFKVIEENHQWPLGQFTPSALKFFMVNDVNSPSPMNVRVNLSFKNNENRTVIK